MTTTTPRAPSSNRPARWSRILRHRWWGAGDTRRLVTPALLSRIEQAIGAGESRHTAQLRICIEGSLPWSYLWQRIPVRERAVMMFAKLRVWDTEANNGVLLYLLLADHAIEVVADRAVARTVGQAEWDAVVAHMSDAFSHDAFEPGVLGAIEEINHLLARAFPRTSPGANELPDTPEVL